MEDIMTVVCAGLVRIESQARPWWKKLWAWIRHK